MISFRSTSFFNCAVFGFFNRVIIVSTSNSADNCNWASNVVNLGVIYYNSGVDKIKHATTKAEKKQAEYEYTRALIYIEQVYEVESNSRDVLYMLKNIYRITGDEIKKKEIEKNYLKLKR